MLPLDRCRAILNADPERAPYSDDEVWAIRDFLYTLARFERAARSSNASPTPASTTPRSRPP